MGTIRSGGDGPPPFVRLASHPLRWRLLRELVQSDRAVRELTSRLGQPQSLVSYHLRLLREGGLVSARRSSADGRDSYYAIDLQACREGLQSVGGALQPSFRRGLDAPVERGSPGRRARRRPNVLFLCTGNSARPRSRRRSSSACRPGRSEQPVPAAIPSGCIPTPFASCARTGSTSARDERSTSKSSAPSDSTRS